MKNIFKLFGYIHQSELTEEYLTQELGKVIGSPTDYDFPKEVENKLFEDLHGVDGLAEYLRYTCAQDMIRNFSSTTDEQRWSVKGAFQRTMYMKNRIAKPKPKDTKLPGLRYTK